MISDLERQETRAVKWLMQFFAEKCKVDLGTRGTEQRKTKGMDTEGFTVLECFCIGV